MAQEATVNETETRIAGPEYSQVTFGVVREVLIEVGYSVKSKWNGIVGSQEIFHWEFVGPKGTLVIETETYIGMSISGPIELVHEVKTAFENTTLSKKP
jgi:hypothetical protein